MQEYWLLITLLVTFSIGIVSFINKVSIERKYNIQLSGLVLYSIMFLFFLTLGFFQGFVSLTELGVNNIILCIFFGIQIYGYSFVTMHALRYIPTSTYFITVRLTSSFILLAIGILAFGDMTSQKQIIGFFFGIIAMLFFLEKEDMKKKKSLLGIIFLIIGISLLVFGHTATKIFSIDLKYAPTFLAIAFGGAYFSALIFGYSHIKGNMHQFPGIMKINIIQSFFYSFYFYFLFYAYNLGELGISYKIQSYSIFIPIILTSIIYKEKISFQKKMAILFTIFSLYFFT